MSTCLLCSVCVMVAMAKKKTPLDIHEKGGNVYTHCYLGFVQDYVRTIFQALTNL